MLYTYRLKNLFAKYFNFSYIYLYFVVLLDSDLVLNNHTTSNN